MAKQRRAKTSPSYPPRPYPQTTTAPFPELATYYEGLHPKVELYTFVTWRTGHDKADVARVLFALECFEALNGVAPAPYRWEVTKTVDVAVTADGQLDLAAERQRHCNLLSGEARLERSICWDQEAEYVRRVTGCSGAVTIAIVEAHAAYVELQGLTDRGAARAYADWARAWLATLN